jgi:negative regulator of flagellin synthesis FlgM
MVDKIMGGKGFGPLGGVKRSGNAAAAKPSATAGATDRVDFSSALQGASKAQAANQTQLSARAEKLQALKAQIDSGTYRPDLEKVAASLLPFLMKDS